MQLTIELIEEDFVALLGHGLGQIEGEQERDREFFQEEEEQEEEEDQREDTLHFSHFRACFQF